MEGFTQLARTCIASSGVDHDIATVESRRRVGSVAAAHLVVVDDVARRLVQDLDAQPIRPVRKSPGRSPAAPRGGIRWRFRTSRPAHQRIQQTALQLRATPRSLAYSISSFLDLHCPPAANA